MTLCERKYLVYVNKFPNNDVIYEPSKGEAAALPDFCVLPDYWKYHVLRLNLKKLGERWRYKKIGNLTLERAGKDACRRNLFPEKAQIAR